MRGTLPSMGKGMRDVFRNAGYNVVVVDEFRTSCTCSECFDGARTEKFRCVANPKNRNKRPAGDDERATPETTMLCHGLVRCKICHRLWNRDVNGARNIYRLAVRHYNGLGRPRHLRRDYRLPDSDDEDDEPADGEQEEEVAVAMEVDE